MGLRTHKHNVIRFLCVLKSLQSLKAISCGIILIVTLTRVQRSCANVSKSTRASGPFSVLTSYILHTCTVARSLGSTLGLWPLKLTSPFFFFKKEGEGIQRRL